MMKTLFSRIAVFLVFVSFCNSASAEQVTFVLRYAGIKLGTLTYVNDVGASSYAAGMRFQTGGLTGLIASVTFDAQSQGRSAAGGNILPVKYREESLRADEREVTEIVWDRKTPFIAVEAPPQPDRLDPRQAIGSIDLMTGMHMLFRAIPSEDACKLNATTYDGKRLMRLKLSDASQDRSGQLTCVGTFSQLKGVATQGVIGSMFSGFDMTYRSLPNGRVRVDRIVLRTPMGPAVLALE